MATDESAIWQTEGTLYEPSFSGEIKKPLSSIEPLPFNERKVIVRRCAMELHKGDILNLGVGMPAGMGRVLSEEGLSEDVIMSTESGMVGGVPAEPPNFGSAYNPQAVMKHGEMFDFIQGGGLDVTCLGLGEVDKDGNLNVSRLGPTLMGPGGFIDITKKTPVVMFCGTFMNKAIVEIQDGKVKVLEEGKSIKFKNSVREKTFAAQYKPDYQKVLYVTERGVFQMINGKLTLIEIAPGIDLEKDILANMEFTPAIAEDLKEMPAEIFYEEWGGLKAYIESKEA